MENASKLALCFVFVSFLAGCASLKEDGKRIWGTSIAHLEAARSSGQSMVVTSDPKTVFAQVLGILKEAKANAYLVDPDQRYIAAMGFVGSVDSTQVGIFFTPQEGGGTRLEVASMSPRLVEHVFKLLSEGLAAKEPSAKGPDESATKDAQQGGRT